MLTLLQGRWLGVTCAALLSGCMQGGMPELSAADVPGALRELDADSPALDAVGMLGVQRPGAPLAIVCTGTLIGPSSVLTAAGCWQALSRTAAPDLGQGTAVFAIGPDAREPLASAAVVDAVEVPDTRPQSEVGAARALEVLHLAKPLAALPRAKLAAASPALIGQALVRVAYAPGAVGDAGQRRVAPVHLTALHARTLEVAAAASGNNPEPCRGSGEPLLSVDEAGELVVYAVASDVSGGDLDTVYTSFVDWQTRAFLEAQSSWVDPCGGLAQQPACAGEVARRCSEPNEGARRIIEQDCTEHGLTCLEAKAGVHCAPQAL